MIIKLIYIFVVILSSYESCTSYPYTYHGTEI